MKKLSESRSPIKPGQRLAGKYRVERVIGAGAMGVVVEARHLELEQQVAVKFLYPEFARASDGAERFRREARAVVKIRSVHVARVLDVGTLDDTGVPYIVMEYLQGNDLSVELDRRGRLPIDHAVRYLLEACEAVAEAHRQGIVHRDLKPANLFLAERPRGDRMVKVLDFGISKTTGGGKQMSLTDTSVLMGSPAYMSPEQLESSRNVDGRADIWSLGVILHELVMGSIPFRGDSVPQLVRSILSGERDALTSRDPALIGLEQVVERCLRQERDERFEDVPALCAALEPYRGGVQGVSTEPDEDPGTRTAPGLGETSTSESPPGESGAAPERADEQPAADDDAEGAAPRPPDGDDRETPADESAGPPAGPGDEAGVEAQAEEHAVESAWGHTQNGHRRSWAARAFPIALVGAGAAVYFLLWQGPEPTPPTAEGNALSDPAAETPRAGTASERLAPTLVADPDESNAPPPAAPAPDEPLPSPQADSPGERAAAKATDTSAEPATPPPTIAPVATPAPVAASAARVTQPTPPRRPAVAPVQAATPAATARGANAGDARGVHAPAGKPGSGAPSVAAVPPPVPPNAPDPPRVSRPKRRAVPDFGGRE